MFEVNVNNVVEQEKKKKKGRRRNTAQVWGSDTPTYLLVST